MKPREGDYADLDGAGVLEKLKSPRTFGVSDIRKLDQLQRHEGTLSAEHKAQLNSLAEYHLSLIGDGFDGSMPSRMLFELRYSNLWKHLRKPVADRVETMNSKQREKLQSLFDRGIESFSHTEMEQFMRYYQSFHLKARRHKLTAQDQVFAKTISQKFVDYAHGLLQGFKIVGGEIKSANPNSDAPGRGNMRVRDKIFVLQVYRMFGRQYDWAPRSDGLPGTADYLKGFSQAIVRELATELTPAGDGQAQLRVELLPLWELVEDLVENEHLSFNQLNEDQKLKLREFAQHARSAHLLTWVKEWQRAGNVLLLPEHLKALRQVRENATDQVFGKDPEQRKEILQRFTEENGKVYVDVPGTGKDGKSERKEVLKAIEEEADKVDYIRAQNAFIDTRDEFRRGSVYLAFKRGINGENGATFGGEQSAEFADLEAILNNTLNLDNPEQDLDRIDSEKEAKEKGLASPWVLEIESDLDTFSERISQALANADLGESRDLKEFNNVFNNFAKYPFGNDFETKKKESQKNIETFKAKASESDARIKQYLDLIDNFTQTDKGVDEVLQKYNAGLRGRIESRRLTAADLAVLFESDLDADIQAALDLEAVVDPNQFVQKLQNFRNGFAQLIEPLIGDIIGEFNLQGQLSVSDEDRMRLWFAVLDKALGHQNIRSKIANNAGLQQQFEDIVNDSFGEVGISSSMLLDSTLSHYRGQIYDQISNNIQLRNQVANVLGADGDDVGDKILQDYLSRYDRMHNHVYESTAKQDAVEAGHKAFVRDRQADLTHQDTVRQNLYQTVGKVDRDQFGALLDKYSRLPVEQQDALLEQLNNRDVYFNLLEQGIDTEGFRRTQFFQLLSPVVPAELHNTALPELAQRYILWQTKAQNEKVLDDVGYRLMNGAPGVPGRHQLQKIKLRASEFEGDFAIVQSQFRHDFDHWNKRLMTGESVEHGEMSDFFGAISGSMILRLRAIVSNASATLSAEFPEYAETFVSSYIYKIRSAIDQLEFEVQTLDRLYDGSTWDRNSSHDLMRIKNAFTNIKNAFSLEHGDLREFEERLQSSFDDIPSTVTYLKDHLGLYEPGGKKKAELKFKKMQRKYEPTYLAYKDRSEKVIKLLKKDIDKYNAKDFKARHGMTKPSAQKMINEMTDSVETYSRGWERFDDPNYFENDFMVKYEDPERQAEALLDFQTWPILESEVKNLSKLNKDYNDWIKHYEKKKFLGTSLLHRANWPRFGVKYTFSLVDLFYRLPKKVFEAFERREERRRERAVANLGVSLFGNSGIGKEFKRMQWEEEDKRVKEFEGQYENENFDFWEAELYKIKGPHQKDEARALINLLIKEGYMRWDKPALWRTLERLQSPVLYRWNPGDLENKKLDDIIAKVGDACSYIWTPKIFTDWDGQLEGNQKKQMESNYKNFDRMCNIRGSLDEYFSETIDKWRNGDKSINPAEYEGFLHRAFENAKFNSEPDRRWFYLILGMTIKNDRGETLLSHEAMSRFNKTHLKALPYFDFFVDGGCWKKDGMPVPEGTPGAHEGSWNHQDVQAWGDFMLNFVGGSFADSNRNGKASTAFFFKYVLNSPTAKLRADRFARMGGKEQDHDDAWMHGAGASYQNLVQLLNRSSQGMDTISPDFAANLAQSYKLYMENTREYLQEMEAAVGNSPEWPQWKEAKLLEAGQMMQKMFMVVNTLAGNYHGNDRTAPQTLDRKYWINDPNGTGVKDNRALINKGMKRLLEMSGESVDDSIFDYTGVLAIGDNYEDRKKNDGYKAVTAEVTRILNDESIYSNLANVERFLNEANWE